jgi:hypothetical protein
MERGLADPEALGRHGPGACLRRPQRPFRNNRANRSWPRGHPVADLQAWNGRSPTGPNPQTPL